MACEVCGARTGHKKGCTTPEGRKADAGRRKGQARMKGKGAMKGARPRICRDCGGTGMKDGRVCRACDGSGEKR